MKNNLFPAILIAGSPHCGKSVLSFLLTQHLRKMNIAHYLFQAVPDSEGDWFQQGQPDTVRPLKDKYKDRYTPAYTSRAQTIIDNRLLPFLVDVGGLPQGEAQFNILRACTHTVLLYRTPQEYVDWKGQLYEMGLLPIAELQSMRHGGEQILETHPVLSGIISGLNRQHPKTGPVFGALLDRIAGVCRYEESFIEQVQLKQAPYPVVSERTLGAEIGIARAGENPYWKPADLLEIKPRITPGAAIAIYGRGPVWLASALGAYANPGSVAVFDARYGWLNVPKVIYSEPKNLKVQLTDWTGYDAQWMEIDLLEAEIDPGTIEIPPMGGSNGLVLSGELPRWFYASLAREFAPKRAWLGIDDPARDRVVIIHSRQAIVSVGDAIQRPGF